MVRLVFATSIEVYSASAIIFIFSYRAERGTEYQHDLSRPAGAESPGRYVPFKIDVQLCRE